MPSLPTKPSLWRTLAPALAAGLVLRLVFIIFFAATEDDSLLYGNIAANLIQHGAYALSTPTYHLTLIRLPGYPLFLALIFRVFGVGYYTPVLYVQMLVDLATCVLLWAFAREHIDARSAPIVLWIAALCPFTASYVAIPMTETVSIFAVALALFAAARLVSSLRQDRIAWPAACVLSAALAAAILLRPDGVLLTLAILPAIVWYARPATRKAILIAATCALLAAAPLVPWTIRNQLRFHLFQPLSPRFATDPGVFIPQGYIRWTKTWFADFASNEEFYWDGNETTLHPNFLPARAFDTPAQRSETLRIIAAYNAGCKPGLPVDSDPAPPICRFTPAQDEAFNRLATTRYATHPFTRRIGLPVIRLADMWLRPRIEYLPLPLRWWQPREEPWPTLFAFLYAALNAALLLAAIIGFTRRRVPFAGMMLAYIALRCALLLTIENAEPRYTLECFPFLFVAAAVALMPRFRDTHDKL